MTAIDTVRSVFVKKEATPEERLYFGMIDRAMAAREYRIISNGKPGHAVYLIHKMLEEAEEEVKILTGKLARDVDGVKAYGDPQICEDAVSLLARGCGLEILIADDMDVDQGAEYGAHPLLAAVSQAGYQDRLAVARTRVPAEDGWPYHFLVMDRSALRVETDPGKAKALVNPNDPKMGDKLHDLFDEWARESEPVDWDAVAA